MRATEIANLTGLMEAGLPTELRRVLVDAGQLAAARGQKIYLVGGIVRDLFLQRCNLDLDLVVEGDAIALARYLEKTNHAEAVVHPRFGTATVRWGNTRIDLAMARSETYSHPGALPTVMPGDIRSDLFRRDFTVNAMAAALNPANFGSVIDLYGGRADLENKLIRILHDKSFRDDATRIWRAVRYEQRLDFRIEPFTLHRLRRDLPMLDTVSGDRIRHELELVLKEDGPEKALRRADGLGVLARVHPSLKADPWLAAKFEAARRFSAPDAPGIALYLALLVFRLSPEEVEALAAYLTLSAMLRRAARDTIMAREAAASLNDPALSPSRVYSALHGYTPTALTATLLATDSPVVREQTSLYLTRLRYVKPILSGDDLRVMGVPPGPLIGEILEKLRQARLDGKVQSRRDERGLADVLRSACRN